MKQNVVKEASEAQKGKYEHSENYNSQARSIKQVDKLTSLSK
jgi:hypothetical protein